MQRLLSLGGFVLGAVAHHSVALGQVQVECDQWAVLHAQGPQSGAIDLRGGTMRIVSAPYGSLPPSFFLTQSGAEGDVPEV